MLDDLLLKRAAEISDCGHYRYSLTRWWDDGDTLAFVMLNPSTADALEDDPTIRRCMSFARREGASGIVVVNLFALRSTDPSVLRDHANPWGYQSAVFENIAADAANAGRPIVCAWGTDGSLLDADKKFLELVTPFDVQLVCLGTTKDGHPRHPLYVRGDQPLVPFAPPQGQDQ